jgi:RNA polymerase sigma-70 factor (ECF subfamily)
MSGASDQSADLQRCLDQLRAGDELARRELLDRACGRLDRLVRKMLRADPRVRRWEDTDDVRQNALVRLYRALEASRPGTVRDFFRLAAVQIRRELIDLARHYYGPEGAGRHHATDKPPGGDAAPPAAREPADITHEPARLAAWTELQERVARLDAAEREVFDLLWYHGLPQAEAAALLNVSERTLQRRWRAVRLKLHELLLGEPPDA